MPCLCRKNSTGRSHFHDAVKKIADVKRDEQNAKSLLKKYRKPLKNVCEAASARQKQAKKRSLWGINEHFEPVFNAAMATQVIFQRFHRPFFIWCLYILSPIGIALSVLTLLPIGICKTDYLSSMGLLIFFVSIIVIFKNEQKIANTLWEKFNSLIADSRTEHMFKAARRLIPFGANYYFSGNMVTYKREKDGDETTIWSKPASGQYYIGEHFIITYKKKSFYPDLFIFINSEAQIVEYMNNLDLTRIHFPETSTTTP